MDGAGGGFRSSRSCVDSSVHYARRRSWQIPPRFGCWVRHWARSSWLAVHARRRFPTTQSFIWRRIRRDYKALGIGKEIEVREDGRRTPRSSDYFEWWYFDGLLDDGTVVVVWFGDNWFYGTHKRAVDIELTPPGKPTRRIMRTLMTRGRFRPTMQISRSVLTAFKGDLQTYTIHVDAAETGGAGLRSRAAPQGCSYRPATGYMEAGDKFFAWLVAVPEGAITGTLTADGVTRQVTAAAITITIGAMSRRPICSTIGGGGAAGVGGHTIIASEIRGKAAVGGTSIPLFFVGDEHGAQVNAYGAEVSAVEGARCAIPIQNTSAPSAPGFPLPPPMERGPIEASRRMTGRAHWNISNWIEIWSDDAFWQARPLFSSLRRGSAGHGALPSWHSPRSNRSPPRRYRGGAFWSRLSGARQRR